MNLHSLLTRLGRLPKHLPIVLVSALLVPAACQSVCEQAGDVAAAERSSEEADEVSLEITFKDQDARLLANQLRMFAGTGLQVRIEAPDSQTWKVSGNASDVRTIRLLATALDTALLTPGHVVRTFEFEHRDARLLANSVRGGAPEGQRWSIIATPEGRWYVIVPQDEVEALEAWIEELDAPS